MDAFDIRCPKCSRIVPAADVNVAALVAKCAPCNKVFGFAGAAPQPAALAPLAYEQAVPPPPDGVTVEGSLSDAPLVADYRSYATRAPAPLRIRYRWFHAASVFMVFFAIAWNAFLVFWYSIGISSNGPWIMFVFPIGHVAVGVTVAKEALAGLFNTTRFDLDGDRLAVKTGPFRWPWQLGSVTVPVAELRQLSVLEKRKPKGGRSFGVIAHLRDGTTRTLVEGLSQGHIASFLERAIEHQLGLPDEPWLNQSA